MSETKVFRLADTSPTFATREKGRSVFGQLQGVWSGQSELIVDWSGVKAASPGFIDEFISQIFGDAPPAFPASSITFAGDNPEVNDLVDRILNRRGIPLTVTPFPVEIKSLEPISARRASGR